MSAAQSSAPNGGSSAENGAPASSRSPSPGRHAVLERRVVDFEVDDGDENWEDEDTLLSGLGTTTHRSRNLLTKSIPIRQEDSRHKKGPEERVAARKKRDTTVSKMAALAADLDALDAEREQRAVELAEKHGVHLKEVRRRMLSASTLKTPRKISLYNAKIARIMADLNDGRMRGDRYKMPEVKRMVNDNPELLNKFTVEEEKELLVEAEEKASRKKHGTRKNNAAANADARRTIAHLAGEVTSLAERAGMLGFAMFTRGHIHDTAVPVTIESWGALDFFREVLNKDPADVSAMFELWAVAREKNATGADTLVDMQKQCTEIITSGLRFILRKANASMNYENYIKSMVVAKGVGLVGWPKDVDFKRMSKQSAIGPLRTLLEALKSGVCKWKVLTDKEKKQLVAQFGDMVSRGEITEKVRKARPSRTRPPTTKSKGRKSRKRRSTHEELDDDDEPAPPRAAPRAAPSEMRRRLLQLVKAKKDATATGTEAGERTKKVAKSKGGDGKRQAAKHSKRADAAAKQKKRSRAEETDEDMPPAKKSKSSNAHPRVSSTSSTSSSTFRPTVKGTRGRGPPGFRDPAASSASSKDT